MENKRKKQIPVLSMYDKMMICQNAYDRMFHYTGPEELEIHFICVAIEDVAPESVNGFKAYEIIPELLEYKPKGRNPINHWFPVNEEGMNARRYILKELIIRFKLSED